MTYLQHLRLSLGLAASPTPEEQDAFVAHERHRTTRQAGCPAERRPGMGRASEDLPRRGPGWSLDPALYLTLNA